MKKLLPFIILFLSVFGVNAQIFPDNTIVKSSNNGKNYLIAGNAPFLLKSNSGLRINPRDVIEVNASVINDLSKIPRDTTLLRELHSDKTYIMYKRRRCRVPQRLLSLFYAEPFVNIVPKGSLYTIPIGDELPDLNMLSQNEFDTLQKIMAYNFKIKYNELSGSDFETRKGNSTIRLDEINISRIKSVNRLITAKFGSDPKFGNETYVTGVPSMDMNPRRGASEPAADLDISRQPLRPQPANNLRGFADIHCHMFANLAFGGDGGLYGNRFYVGSPYGKVDSVLVPCSYSGVSVSWLRFQAWVASYVACNLGCFAEFWWLPGVSILCNISCIPIATVASGVELNILLAQKSHGMDGSRDVVGEMMRNHYKYASKNSGDIPWALPGVGSSLSHNPEGFPSFNGWPRWNDFSHQKAHIEYLRNSYNGGMRLIVMMAVENEHLHDLIKLAGQASNNPYDEMSGIYKQLDEAKKMEQYVLIHQGGWFKIVYSPQEAEQAIKDGKLAMVLGTENGRFIRNSSDYKLIKKNLKDLYDRGVRHVFTVHEDDNNFGGPAYFAERKQDAGLNPAWVQNIDSIEPAPQYKAATNGHRNKKGLTPQGVFLQQSLMSLGMIYDIDHMSEHTKEATLDLAGHANYPGLAASHCGFTAINDLHQLHEGQLTYLQLQKLNNLGGVIGLIVNQGVFKDDIKQYPALAPRISYTCGGSTETFAQPYSYALDHFKIANTAKNRGIAFGSDIVPIPLIGPRFGPEGCPGTGTSIKPPLSYPFISLFDGKQMDKTVVGGKSYDFNTDGMAHIGMYPDFIADLQTIGFSPSELEPIYKSAEEYIEMWKKADSIRLNEYIKYLSEKNCTQDILFFDVDDATPVVYLLHEGIKSIALTAGGNNIITLPHEIVQALPTLGKARVSYTLINRISETQSKIKITAKSCSGNLLNGTVIDIQGNNLGNTNSEITINTVCITRRPRSTDRPTAHAPTSDETDCKFFTCSNKEIIVLINGYVSSNLTINVSGLQCE